MLLVYRTSRARRAEHCWLAGRWNLATSSNPGASWSVAQSEREAMCKLGLVIDRGFEP